MLSHAQKNNFLGLLVSLAVFFLFFLFSANFTAAQQLQTWSYSVSTSPSGHGSVRSAGGAWTSGLAGPVMESSLMSFEARPSSSVREFESWTGRSASLCREGVTSSVCTIPSVQSDINLVANFKSPPPAPKINVTTSPGEITQPGSQPSPPGLVSLNSQINTYHDVSSINATVAHGSSNWRVTATPSSGHVFTNWSGASASLCLDGRENRVCRLGPVTADRTLIANFDQQRYTYSVNSASEVMGMVIVREDGRDRSGTRLSGNVSHGQEFVARASSNYSVNWTGTSAALCREGRNSRTCTIPNVRGNINLTANFRDDTPPPTSHTYTVNTSGPGRVNLGSLMGGTPSNQLRGTVNGGNTFVVSAEAVMFAGGSGTQPFINWTGTSAGLCQEGRTSLTCTISNVRGNINLTANFREAASQPPPARTYSYSVTTNPQGLGALALGRLSERGGTMVNSQLNGTVNQGGTFTVSGVSRIFSYNQGVPGHIFENWTGTSAGLCQEGRTSSTCTIANARANINLVANFRTEVIDLPPIPPPSTGSPKTSFTVLKHPSSTGTGTLVTTEGTTGPSISCGVNCDESTVDTVSNNRAWRIQATPSSGSRLTSWEYSTNGQSWSPACNTANSCGWRENIPQGSHYYLRARFDQGNQVGPGPEAGNRTSLTVLKHPSSTGTGTLVTTEGTTGPAISCGVSCDEKTETTTSNNRAWRIQATPSSNSVFVGWDYSLNGQSWSPACNAANTCGWRENIPEGSHYYLRARFERGNQPDSGVIGVIGNEINRMRTFFTVLKHPSSTGVGTIVTTEGTTGPSINCDVNCDESTVDTVSNNRAWRVEATPGASSRFVGWEYSTNGQSWSPACNVANTCGWRENIPQGGHYYLRARFESESELHTQ